MLENILENKMPKYYLLKQIILKKIKNKEFKENESIPSEREFIENYKLSRITVRKAIDELVREGYLYRIQGKGTYVKNDGFRIELFEIHSCTEDVLKLGKRPKKIIVKSEVIKSDINLSNILNIRNNDDIFHLERITYANEETLNFTSTFLPKSIFPNIEKHNFEKKSLYELIENCYEIKISKAKRSFEAVLAKGKIAKYLEIEEGTPIILFTCITYGIWKLNEEIPIETFKCYYRTDKYKFHINQVK